MPAEKCLLTSIPGGDSVTVTQGDIEVIINRGISDQTITTKDKLPGAACLAETLFIGLTKRRGALTEPIAENCLKCPSFVIATFKKS